jgi:hypothetical protein
VISSPLHPMPSRAASQPARWPESAEPTLICHRHSRIVRPDQRHSADAASPLLCCHPDTCVVTADAQFFFCT